MKNLPNCYTYNELSKGLCQTCTHYIDKKDYVFRIVVKEAGEIFEAQSTSHLLLICNEGSLQLSLSPSHSFTVQSSHMLLIPEHTQWRVEVKEKCDLLFLKFDAYVNVCPYISSSTYKKYLDNQDYTFYQLELLPTMKTLTELFIQKIKLGPACLLYHKTKKLDFFSFLSMCYSDQEIARLLYPLLNTEFMLTELVQKYADKVKNVNELIELSGMSRTSFYQKFKEIYGMSAKQWLLQRKAMLIKKRFQEPQPILKEIRFEFGFSSPSQFNRFCNRYLGYNPSDFIENRNRSKD